MKYEIEASKWAPLFFVIEVYEGECVAILTRAQVEDALVEKTAQIAEDMGIGGPHLMAAVQVGPSVRLNADQMPVDNEPEQYVSVPPSPVGGLQGCIDHDLHVIKKIAEAVVAESALSADRYEPDNKSEVAAEWSARVARQREDPQMGELDE